MPTNGIGAFSGTPVGTVSDTGATRTAAGAFSQSYNFAALTGTLNIAIRWTELPGRDFRLGQRLQRQLDRPPNRSGSASDNPTPMPDSWLGKAAI